MNLNTPPIVYGINIENGGLCDVHDCEEAIVEGNLFLDRKGLTCKMRRIEVLSTIIIHQHLILII